MTKKLLTALAFPLLGTAALAQVNKGTFVLGGYVSTGVQTTNQGNNLNNYSSNTNQFGINLGPSVGYLVKENLELGATINLSYTSAKGESNFQSYNGNGYGIGISPYIKKYLALTDRLMVYGVAGVNASFSHYTSKSSYEGLPHGESRNKSRNFGAGIAPGLTYFATDKIGISASFGSFRFSKTFYNDSNTRSPQEIGFDLSPRSLNFGFNYYIGR